VPLITQAGPFRMQERLTGHVDLARAALRWLARTAAPPSAPPGAESVDAPLFPTRPGLEDALLLGAAGTWAERAARLFAALCKARACSVVLSGMLASAAWLIPAPPAHGSSALRCCLRRAAVRALDLSLAPLAAWLAVF
jgi:hypothetical protein